MGVTAANTVTVVSTVTDDFARIHKEWALGVRSMVYQRSKGRIQAGELDRFRSLEQKMDDAWGRLAPFDQVEFCSKKGSLWLKK